MSFKSLQIAAFCVLLGLSGCGFTPLYSQGTESHGALSQNLGAIGIPVIPERDGQYLRNVLIDRLQPQGQTQDTRYTLTFTKLRKSIVSIGVRKDATATRGQLAVDTVMTLRDATTNQPLLTRELHVVGGYNRLDNLYAAQVSEDYSTDRVLEGIADRAVTELALYFKRPDNARETPPDAPDTDKRERPVDYYASDEILEDMEQ